MPSTQDFLRQFVRLGHDTLARVPRRWLPTAIAGVCGIAVCLLIGAGFSGASIEPDSTASISEQKPALPCEQQVWPYISTTCLRGAAAPAASPARDVRLISLDRDAPTKVLVVPVPEQPKQAAPQPAQAKRNARGAREVVVRDGRSGQRDRRRVFVVPTGD